MKNLFILLLSLFASLSAFAKVSIEDCVKKATANYPLINKYYLLENTKNIDLAEINKSWLPRIGIFGQITGQNEVPAFPNSLNAMLDQMGQSLKGMSKVQYKIGVDVSQNIWDGGNSKSQRELARARDAVNQSALDVEMYSIRQRVESLFFAILLTEEQIAQNEITYRLLMKNLETLRSKISNGVAMQSDADMIEAQALTVSQGLVQAHSAVDGYRRVLELFIGESLTGESLLMPSDDVLLNDGNFRPELQLYANRLAANEAEKKFSETALMPKIGLFAQAYYGYPGFDYFKSMRERSLSFNILAGIKVSWNIDAFYTRKDKAVRASVNELDINADKELFLFNNKVMVTSQRENIKGLRDMIKEDARIIELRANVRRAAESQLENGVIDATALLTKISDENSAQLSAKLHEIQLVKEIYNLKYITNQ
ncbi:MAG: TolC family protein [Muribaculaceae bacterium]|nr:TolC family protein [Muribaculaceae bacterium]